VKFDLKSSEIETNIKQQSHFICEFNTFSNDNSSYRIQVYFETELQNVTLTSNIPSIQSIPFATYSPIMTPIGTSMNISIPFDFKYPTNFSNYDFTIRYNKYGSFVKVGDCKHSIPFLNCTINSMNTLSSSTKSQFNIFMNNERSLALSPYFTFYNNFKLLEILPSTYISLNQTDSIYLRSSPLQYFGNGIKVKYSYNGVSIVHNCTFINETFIKCGYPKFDSIANVTLSITQTEPVVYEELNMKLVVYNQSSFIFTEIKPKLISFTIQTTIEVIGSGFFDSKDIIVHIYDALISKYSKGVYFSDSIIKTTIDPFFDVNAAYPRELNVKISFDGGESYHSSGKIMVNDLDLLEITPKFIPLSEKTMGIKIMNYPSHGLYYNKSKFVVDYFLLKNETEYISMNCEQNITLNCDLNSVPLSLGYYKFKMRIRNFVSGESKDIFIYSKNEIYVYDSKINSIEPKLLVVNSNEKITVSGKWDTKLFTSVKFKFKYFIDSLFQLTEQNLIVSGTITETNLFVNIPSKVQTVSSLDISFTFNEINFHPLSFTQNIPLYTINSIQNLGGVGNNFLSDSSSTARVLGKNFMNTGNNIKLILSTSKEIVDITSISSLNITSSNELYFRFPNVTEIGFSYEFRYPYRLNVGLSLNGGNYFASTVINFLNSYPQAIFSGVYPSITPRGDLNVTVYGIDLDLAKNCSFYIEALDGGPPVLVYETPTGPVDLKTNSLLCILPKSIQDIYSKLIISVKNKEGERNTNVKEILIYDPPTLFSTIPSTGESFGGLPITIFGENIPKPLGAKGAIFVKFGQIIGEKECLWISSSQVRCTIQAHPPGSAEVSISYNKRDWHSLGNSTRFRYTTCDAGYTAENYRDPCFLCPPGTFKQAAGLFECTPCEENRYSSFAGSKICEICPANSTTGPNVIGSNSHDKCVCQKGFYLNPIYSEQSGAYKKCISCPTGAMCDNLNTTIPIAQKGYWNYKTNFHNFYLCKPKNSCGGYGAENCTLGYKGIRCGQCITHWYKFRGECRQCDKTEITWLRLLAFMSALALVTGLFFVLSSTKVHHIASIAIAFSFWQILSMLARFDIQWPSLIGGSLSASSVSNFNVDFLSPNCIFPEISYITLWFLQMMMPIAFFISFMILFSLLVLRSLFSIPIRALFGLCFKIRYIKPLTSSEDEDDSKKKNLFVDLCGSVLRTIRNAIGFILNFTIWYFTEKSNGRELMKIFNRILNSYFAFLSFSFIFIMTTASEVFVCTRQPDGTNTLDASPDIICYQGTWLYMLPLTLFWYLLFGGGSFLYFVLIFFNFKKWSTNKNFKERNKFMLSRFKRKYFFWEAVVTLRKTILSILYIFLDDMLVIVAGIVLLFAGFLLHTNFVPFKRKFHNVMDYFVIIVTMTTLFFGLLFFVDDFPAGTRQPAEYLSFSIIVISTFIVVLMILWDANTRRKNDKKKLRKKALKIAQLERAEIQNSAFLNDLHNKMHDEDLFKFSQVPWDIDYEFQVFGFKTESETPEEGFKTMNDIFYALISPQRIRRKLFLIRRKGKSTTSKVIKKFKKKTKEEKELDAFTAGLKGEDIKKRLRKSLSTNVIPKELEREFIKLEIEKKTEEFKIQQVEKRKTLAMSNAIGDLSDLQKQINQEDMKQKRNSKLKSIFSNVKKLSNPDDQISDEEKIKYEKEARKKTMKMAGSVKLRNSRVYGIISSNNLLETVPQEEKNVEEPVVEVFQEEETQPNEIITISGEELNE
jgi:hypothetical protein